MLYKTNELISYSWIVRLWALECEETAYEWVGVSNDWVPLKIFVENDVRLWTMYSLVAPFTVIAGQYKLFRIRVSNDGRQRLTSFWVTAHRQNVCWIHKSTSFWLWASKCVGRLLDGIVLYLRSSCMLYQFYVTWKFEPELNAGLYITDSKNWTLYNHPLDSWPWWSYVLVVSINFW